MQIDILEDMICVYREDLIEAEIVELLKKIDYFIGVAYTGKVIMLPNIYIRHEAEFYDEESNTWDVPSEYSPGSYTRKIMDEIVSIFVDHDIEEDSEVWLSDWS